jgi:hypothetical protein
LGIASEGIETYPYRTQFAFEIRIFWDSNESKVSPPRLVFTAWSFGKTPEKIHSDIGPAKVSGLLFDSFLGAIKSLRIKSGSRLKAGEGNRTLVCSLGSYRSTIELHPRMCCERRTVQAIGFGERNVFE